jgi:hypothetical protein
MNDTGNLATVHTERGAPLCSAVVVFPTEIARAVINAREFVLEIDREEW